MYMPTDSTPSFTNYSIAPQQRFFYPYADNGGSIVAIAGADFVIIGADTRISNNFSIYSRNQNKLFQLTNTTVLSCTGCWCDTLTLSRVVFSRIHMYQLDNRKPMSVECAAQMISIIMYYKRFFPYGLSAVLAGLDKDGKGCIYSFDCIGHCEEATYHACGTAGDLLQPFLDNHIGFKNMLNVEKKTVSLDRALCVLKDAFTSAAERDIYTGDSVVINIITKADGLTEEVFELRKD